MPYIIQGKSWFNVKPNNTIFVIRPGAEPEK